MNKIIAWLKSIRISQIVTVFFAGILLFVSTACGSGVSAKTAPLEGGMNNYSDVDARRDTTEVQAKAKALKDQAERNLTNRTGNPAKAGQRVLDAAPDSLQEVGTNIKRGAEDASEAIKSKVSRDIDKTQQALEKTADNSKDAVKKAQRAADDASDAVKAKANKDINRTQRALDNAAEAID